MSSTLLARMLNAAVHPVIPSRGSVGASGDLAPLAHLALVLIGEGEATVDGEAAAGARGAARAPASSRSTLGAKEGLALLNGTQLHDRRSARSRCATRAALARDRRRRRRHEPRGDAGHARAAFDDAHPGGAPHPGQVGVAAPPARAAAGSEIGESHRDCEPRVQDAYSLRCMPQVHGAARDALALAGRVLEVEINAATDNPLVFAAPAG